MEAGEFDDLHSTTQLIFDDNSDLSQLSQYSSYDTRSSIPSSSQRRATTKSGKKSGNPKSKINNSSSRYGLHATQAALEQLGLGRHAHITSSRSTGGAKKKKFTPRVTSNKPLGEQLLDLRDRLRAQKAKVYICIYIYIYIYHYYKPLHEALAGFIYV